MRERGWQSMITDFAADWFHPNDCGRRVWADAFWESIDYQPLALPSSPPEDARDESVVTG